MALRVAVYATVKFARSNGITKPHGVYGSWEIVWVRTHVFGGFAYVDGWVSR